jgi:hypothetical protein
MRDYGDEDKNADFDENDAIQVRAAGFTPHPGLSDTINRNILTSAIEGGAVPSKLGPTKKGYTVTTRNRTYEVLKTATGWTIAGHPRYCPRPTQCNIHGSTWGGSMLKMDFIGRGMHLEVGLPSGTMTTSPIIEVEELS